MENMKEIEEKVNIGVDLLEIAKSYCEVNYDKARELAALGTLLEIISENQQNISRAIDCVYIG